MAVKRTKTLRPISTEIDTKTLEELDKAAASKNLSRSELMRQYLNEGLKVKSYEDNLDMITRIIRQEIKNEINLGDIRTISSNNAERIIKVLMKLAKPLVANYFLHIAYLDEIAPADSLAGRVADTVSLSMEYMSSRDDLFSNDTDRLMNMAKQL
ncbi:MAG: ribbon-helix-helix protein, CopG family [Lachnospiraceae bacterium]|nr:ribbon-helix-helix protein, CopG family [Lachnospiraceae bacterium]